MTGTSHLINLINRMNDIKSHDRSAKKIQKLLRRIIAWSRFRRITVYRRMSVAQDAQVPLQRAAANIIGHYYKRHRIEWVALNTRFRNRAKMIAEYRRLEALREQVMLMLLC